MTSLFYSPIYSVWRFLFSTYSPTFVISYLLNNSHTFCLCFMWWVKWSEVAQSCPTFATLWTVAYHAPLSIGFSRQEYWSGLPFPSPRIFPTQGWTWVSCIVGRRFYCLSLLQFRSVAKSGPTLWDLMNRSTPGLPVHHQLQEFTQIHVHRVSDDIQPSHPLSSPSPPAPNPYQHHSLFQWVNS